MGNHYESYGRKWYEKNKEAQQQRSRDYYKLNADAKKARHRDYVLKNRYGLTKDDYYALLELQNNSCAICKQPAIKTLDVDHCHTTNKVRGLLCNNCNRGLGHFKDNLETLEAAIDYLKKDICDISGKGGTCGS